MGNQPVYANLKQAWRHRTSILKIARLVDRSCSVVFSICPKWINNCETRNRHLVVGPPRISRKGRRKFPGLVQQNRRQRVGQFTA
ncbi:hypothetical protein TNCV_1732721 [Trichonephila clavipes]|nr:hypothetical protein TNCV_1732721 [Trichonephila clavipes]